MGSCVSLSTSGISDKLSKSVRLTLSNTCFLRKNTLSYRRSVNHRKMSTMKITLNSNSLDLSIVIAALNEGENLRVLLPLLHDLLNSLGISWEILVVDGNSSDGTDKIVSETNNAYCISEPKKGYGLALLRGFSEARGEYIITMDADLSHPAMFLPSLWDSRNNSEIVIASRYVPGGKADQPYIRYTLSRILNSFFSVGLSISVAKDMSSGYRLYKKSIFRDMDFSFTNFVILIEILLKSYEKGMRVSEVPFHYQPRGSGSSKARIINFGKDYLRLFYKIWKIRNSIQFPDYDWRAYDSRIWLQRYWQRTRHKIIMRYAKDYSSICDVGCGSSRILADLPQAIGVDMRIDKLVFMRRVSDRLVRADGMRLPFKDNQFECVLCSQVIEHIPEENGKLIDELNRILKPDGILIIGTPDYDRWEWNAIEWVYGKVAPGAYADEHVTHYSFKSLSSALKERGHTIIEYDYVGRGELIIKSRKSYSTCLNKNHEYDTKNEQ